MTYVAKGTRPGYDVNTASEYLNTFNSSFPLLNIGSTGVSSSTINHGLGYFPFFFTTYNAAGFLPGGINQFSGFDWSMSTSQLVRSSGTSADRYYIARLNLTNNFSNPSATGSEVQAAINPDYEFKIAKEGKDINSDDMRDFSIHSNTISPLVHKVEYKTMVSNGNDYTAVVTHDLPYTPLAFAFIKPAANSIGRSTDRMYALHPPIGTTDDAYLVGVTYTPIGGSPVGDSSSIIAFATKFVYSSPPDVSIVILKDPFLKNTINVSYP